MGSILKPMDGETEEAFMERLRDDPALDAECRNQSLLARTLSDECGLPAMVLVGIAGGALAAVLAQVGEFLPPGPRRAKAGIAVLRFMCEMAETHAG